MNILIVHNYYKIPGGEDTVVANERNMLEKHGNHVFLYTRSNKELDNYNGLKKLVLPFEVLFSKKTYNDIRKIIKENNIDIVHVHNTVCMISPSVYYAAFSYKIPIIQTIHNFRLLCPKATFLRNGKICDECVTKGLIHSCRYGCYRNSKSQTFALAFTEMLNRRMGTYSKLNYICLTEFNNKQLLRINKQKEYIKPSKVYIKPNFVDFYDNKIVPYEKRENRIIYVGRLSEEKGLKVLLPAWKSIKEYSLLICGSGPESDWIAKYIRANNLHNVELMGFIDNQDVKDLIANSKALVLPTQWYEGFPMVLVESFSKGTPVIGSNIGNVNDIIIEGVNGYHFQYDSVDSLTNAVRNLHDISETTFKYSQKLYSECVNYNELMSIYQNCIKGNDRK